MFKILKNNVALNISFSNEPFKTARIKSDKSQNECLIKKKMISDFFFRKLRFDAVWIHIVKESRFKGLQGKKIIIYKAFITHLSHSKV